MLNIIVAMLRYYYAMIYLFMLLLCHVLPCYIHAMLYYVHHATFMSQDMGRIQNKHLIGNLDIPHVVLLNQSVDLFDDGLWIPVPVGIQCLLVSESRFSILERRLNAAKSTMVGTTQCCV